MSHSIIRNLTRDNKRKKLLKKGEHNRRCGPSIYKTINGRIYEEYYHFTKGTRIRYVSH